MITKNRILLLKDYLQDNSDEQHPVRTGEIRRYLEENGCPVTVQTLRADIESLLASGYEIEITEAEGMPTRYGWISREWSAPETQILVDAVSSSQFITRKKSNELIRKLAGPDFRLLAVKVDWFRDLSPWPAPAVYGDIPSGTARNKRWKRSWS